MACERFSNKQYKYVGAFHNEQPSRVEPLNLVEALVALEHGVRARAVRPVTQEHFPGLGFRVQGSGFRVYLGFGV